MHLCFIAPPLHPPPTPTHPIMWHLPSIQLPLKGGSMSFLKTLTIIKGRSVHKTRLKQRSALQEYEECCHLVGQCHVLSRGYG